MSKVSEKNTKKEILEYVKEMEAKLAGKQEARKTTADVKKEEEIKTVKASAAQLVSTGIVNEETVEKYNNLLDTIKMLDKELEEVYEIQRNVNTLEALIITYQDKNETLLKDFEAAKAEQEKEFSERKTAWEASIKKLQEDHDKLVKELKEKAKEEKAAIDKERAREEEQYAYDTKRKREIEDDEWADIKAAREKAISIKAEQVVEREKIAEEAIKNVEDLKATVESLEAKMVEVKEESFAEGKAKAAKEYAIQKSYIERECEAKVARLEDKISSLETNLDQERTAHNDTKAKLELAYQQVTNTAMAVANAGVKVSMDTNK